MILHALWCILCCILYLMKHVSTFYVLYWTNIVRGKILDTLHCERAWQWTRMLLSVHRYVLCLAYDVDKKLVVFRLCHAPDRIRNSVLRCVIRKTCFMFCVYGGRWNYTCYTRCALFTKVKVIRLSAGNFSRTSFLLFCSANYIRKC